MATSPTPDSAIRIPRKDERVVTPRAPRTVEVAQPVDREALEQIRRAALDEEWRRAGQGD